MNAHARTFTAKPAIRESVPLLIGLFGCSGSGKTFSALRLDPARKPTFMIGTNGSPMFGPDALWVTPTPA